MKRIKQLFGVTVLCYCLCTNAFGQKSGDALLGKWLKLPKKDLIIEVYKMKGQYIGKINWSKSPDKPAGFVIMDNLTFNSKSGSWENGKIHAPNSSRVYSAEASLEPNGNLRVRGYKGAKFIGSSRTFQRVK